MFIFSIRANGSTVIENGYDYMGHRYMKKVTVGEIVTLHQHYLYRGYLQIAALDLTRSNAPALWLLHWDPTQPVATRPLSLRKNGTWYTYGHDLTKNVTELYKADGTIATAYDYTPYGSVTASGIDQPIQWSSEHYDPELALVYYNYRHYNPADGRWINRDPIAEEGGRNLYGFVGNNPIDLLDSNGLVPREITRTDYARNSLYVNGKRYVGYTSLEAYYIYQYTEAAGKCCCNAIATKWRIFSIVEHPQIFPVLSPANFMDEFRKINNMLYSEEDFDKTADYPFADIEGTKIHERQHVAQYIAEEAEISEKMQAPISHCKNLQSNECQVIREMCTSLSQQQSGWSELKEQHLADIDRWMNNRYPGALRERDSLTEEWKYYARKYGNRRINN